ncbi:hypothetical protein [Bartonella sp. B1099]|uniref:hypothetical protein n=1 Tax=Bartonella sp. B1099 TaxID=2911422 RepID=UPI0020C3CBB8|nr:hypothetical protein [Bartonella sp. B1099]
MKVIITKPMCVVGDNKSTVRFEPSTSSNPFVEISNQVYARLKRANAVKPFVEIKTTTKSEKINEPIKPIEKETVQISSESSAEETSLQQTETPKASKSSTPPAKKLKN